GQDQGDWLYPDDRVPRRDQAAPRQRAGLQRQAQPGETVMSSVHVSTESKQDHATPPLFLGAVERAFGCRLVLDLAASLENRKCEDFIGAEEDSLSVDWNHRMTMVTESMWDDGNEAAWLNPPFRGVDPWMEKCK